MSGRARKLAEHERRASVEAKRAKREGRREARRTTDKDRTLAARRRDVPAGIDGPRRGVHRGR